MHFAIDTPHFGDYSDPRLLAELAHEAEAAGWDGFFLWDHIGAGWPFPVGDPWMALAAMAMATERIKLGPLITPVPRRRPWKLARETATLDHLSQGRVILGVGIGSDRAREYSCFGESTDDKGHGAMFDEGLEVLVGLWSGEPFSYSGNYYHIQEAQFLPPPLQSPRIPIWVADVWPHKRPLRRAATWDGVVPMAEDHLLTPDEIRKTVAIVQEQRTSTQPFDVAYGFPGMERKQIADLLAAYAEAGIVLGVLWSLWHLPLFLFVPGYNGAGTGLVAILIPFVTFVIVIIAYAVIFTWVFNNTRGSLGLSILLHASINTAPAMLPLLFPSLSLSTLFGLSRILVWVVAAVLIIAATRGRLSYQRYLRETALPAPLTDREQEQGEVRISV